MNTRFSLCVHGAGRPESGTGDLFQDTLQVLPCKLLAGIPAGNGPETNPPRRFVTQGFTSINYLQVMVVGDFDQDGLADLVTVGEYDKYTSVLLNRSPLFVDGFEAGD